ncbi:MAG: cell envelope biogenesis protein LolA [Arcobacter sp.]|nr:MAG: cell envelope biogenesis protein LolA [Arcobacter sp.]
MVYKVLFILLLSISSMFGTIKFDELKSFRANFVQTVANESGKTIEYKGKVFIKNNRKVLWKYETPIIKNVYVLENIAIVDEPELEQAIYTTLENSIDMIKLLKNAKKIEENKYQTKLYNIDYIISIKNDKINSLSYTDELANKIVISFLDAEQNIEIEDDLFNFLAPDFYDIIKK